MIWKEELHGKFLQVNKTHITVQHITRKALHLLQLRTSSFQQKILIYFRSTICGGHLVFINKAKIILEQDFGFKNM